MDVSDSYIARLKAENRARRRRDVDRSGQRFTGAVHTHLLEGWDDRYDEKPPTGITSSTYVADQWARDAIGTLDGAKVHKAFDEQAIRDHAENYSRLCGRCGSLEAMKSLALSVGVPAPHGRTVTVDGAKARLCDPIWWRRQLRKRWTRAAENGMRELGMIRKGSAPYASDDAVRHRRGQKRRMRAYLESHCVVNEEGTQLPLLELAERSLANPALRRGEFMCRAKGFELIAKDLGHVAEFVTLTAPSFFHAQLASGGRNPIYQRALVREAQQWLCKQWARARAKFKRLSLLVYGFRIAEPHHDATPHWHLLLFVRTHQVGAVRLILKGCWLSEHADEAGAEKYRARFEAIDPERGSATGYVAKYVSKNIDGAGSIGEEVDHDTGNRIADGIDRVDAWASVHGIRQFQQIGGPPVGLWRETRRLRSRSADRDIERARHCADHGDWRGFVQAVGGIACGRRTNMRVERCETGALNKYGEARPAAIIGVRYASAVELTRLHCWRIERNKGRFDSGADARRFKDGGSVCSALPSVSSSSLGPVAITVRGAPHDLSSLPLDDRQSSDRAWLKLIYGAPSGWTNPSESSTYGPELN